MAITQNVPSEIQEMTAEQLRELAKKKEAQEEMTKLEATGVDEFINSANQVNSLEAVYRLCSNFKWRIEKVRRVLSPPVEGTTKRGRKKKQK
jgi:hypothetical protein